MLETWEFWWISNTLSVLFQQFLFRKKASLARVLFLCRFLRGFNWMAGENPWPRGGNHYCNPQAPTALNSLLHFRLGFLCLFSEKRYFLKKFQSFGGLPIESEGSQSHEIPLKRQPSSAQCLFCLQVMINSDLLTPEVSIPLGHWTMLRIVEERVLRQP